MLAELEHTPLDLPPGLELEWLGVAGFRLTYEDVSLLVDPYVSRVPLRDLILRRPARPDEAVLARYVKPPGPVAGILIGHTHWDHAVDAPALAKRHDAPMYGSASLAHLMALHGLPSVVVEPRKRYELGPFTVSFTPSRHSKLILGRKVPFAGELTCEDVHALHPGAYKCGAIYGIRIEVAGIALYHQGSAELDDDQLGREPVDVFLAGVAGRHVSPRYWERILPKLDPRVLVPTHYDDFFTPLGRPLKLIRKANLESIPDEVHAVTRDATVAALRRVD
ncbi:MBL fold metallo-hydrolase [Solirubrobacter sp. CPCC 204708]|uniref:MBL fold metallo-hydrolase n=1 Tax=Solirubrobacter deserti TaxID=2282478 RepID=A0ABT4RLC3_9ACTN|nr:MBL fold metallo-hydrolase [Solirubrobacter deserti]MBE2320455.1 MBL fold metallo-hydrolase [Solirubrobacter deserti]MDA0139354.1 MBL fold metallo-hydrolase [Solirubrobacter deserti]